MYTILRKAHPKMPLLLIGLILLLYILATPEQNALAQFATPVVNGNISSGEYGNHTDGQNQQTSGGTVWYMTWDDNNLYFAISNANTSEAAVVYIDTNPLAPINGGTDADGTNVGFNYDGTNFAELQFRANIVLYVKNSYREYRTANGSNGWSGPTTYFGVYADNGSNLREFSLPWSAVGGRPTSFAWFGYATSSSGFVYAPVPPENPSGNIGTAARYVRYYIVNNTGNGTSTKPFSRNCYVFNGTSDISGFGAISVYDFTINTTGRTISRGSGAWNIEGTLGVYNGTINFGSTSDNATIKGKVYIGSGGTLTLSNSASLILQIGNSGQVDFWNNGTFNAGSSTVEFRGHSNQISRILGSATTTFHNVTLVSESAVDRRFGVDFYDQDTSARAVINGTLTLNQYTFVAEEELGSSGGSGTDGSPIYGPSSTLYYNNTASFNSAAEWKTSNVCGQPAVPYNVTIANNTTVNINAEYRLSDLTLVYPAGSNKTACGAISIQNGTLQSTAGTLTVKGNFTNNSAFTHNNGTVSFNGSSTIFGTAVTTFHHLRIETGASLTAHAVNINLDGDLTNSGTFNHNNGKITFVGTGIQKVTLNTTTAFYDFTVNYGAIVSETVTADNGSIAGELINDGVIRKSKSGLGSGTTSFGLTGAVINVFSPGSLTALRVDRVGWAHPQENYQGGGGYILDTYFDLSPNGSVGNAELCLAYTQGEFDANGNGITEQNLRICRWTGSGWSCPSRGANSSTVTNRVCADSVSGFSDWVIGQVGPLSIELIELQAAPAVPPAWSWPILGVAVSLLLAILAIQRRRQA